LSHWACALPRRRIVATSSQRYVILDSPTFDSIKGMLLERLEAHAVSPPNHHTFFSNQIHASAGSRKDGVPAYGRKKTAPLRNPSQLKSQSGPAPAPKWLRGVKSAAADSAALEWLIYRQFGCPYLVGMRTFC